MRDLPIHATTICSPAAHAAGLRRAAAFVACTFFCLIFLWPWTATAVFAGATTLREAERHFMAIANAPANADKLWLPSAPYVTRAN